MLISMRLRLSEEGDDGTETSEDHRAGEGVTSTSGVVDTSGRGRGGGSGSGLRDGWGGDGGGVLVARWNTRGTDNWVGCGGSGSRGWSRGWSTSLNSHVDGGWAGSGSSWGRDDWDGGDRG